jgi:hypothetical protein
MPAQKMRRRHPRRRLIPPRRGATSSAGATNGSIMLVFGAPFTAAENMARYPPNPGPQGRTRQLSARAPRESRRDCPGSKPRLDQSQLRPRLGSLSEEPCTYGLVKENGPTGALLVASMHEPTVITRFPSSQHRRAKYRSRRPKVAPGRPCHTSPPKVSWNGPILPSVRDLRGGLRCW